MKYEIEIPAGPVRAQPAYEQTAKGRAQFELHKLKQGQADLRAAQMVLQVQAADLLQQVQVLERIIGADDE